MLQLHAYNILKTTVVLNFAQAMRLGPEVSRQRTARFPQKKPCSRGNGWLCGEHWTCPSLGMHKTFIFFEVEAGSTELFVGLPCSASFWSISFMLGRYMYLVDQCIINYAHADVDACGKHKGFVFPGVVTWWYMTYRLDLYTARSHHHN